MYPSSMTKREAALWVILIVVIALAAGIKNADASPFPEADACKEPAKRVMTRDENGVANVKCVAPAEPKTAPGIPIQVRVTYGRALPRDYAECMVVETTVPARVEYRCVALIAR